DPGDYLNSGVQGPNDAFNEFYHSQTLTTLTALDLTNVDVLGFRRADLSAASVSINDVSITEGNAGTQLLTFTVTRTGGTSAFSVNYATANDTATAGSDY